MKIRKEKHYRMSRQTFGKNREQVKEKEPDFSCISGFLGIQIFLNDSVPFGIVELVPATEIDLGLKYNKLKKMRDFCIEIKNYLTEEIK